ncbi:hypothetical protein [Halobellus rufus]|uniref:hypothetical protein n=1 Tax=Halobellus rufus TaxID=1448860 RepID=UPI0006798839|nr:hypothetical protein [Halobellus rufus]
MGLQGPSSRSPRGVGRLGENRSFGSRDDRSRGSRRGASAHPREPRHCECETEAAHKTFSRFGGVGASGIGQYNADEVLHEFTRAKWVSVQHEKRDYGF